MLKLLWLLLLGALLHIALATESVSMEIRGHHDEDCKDKEEKKITSWLPTTTTKSVATTTATFITTTNTPTHSGSNKSNNHCTHSCDDSPCKHMCKDGPCHQTCTIPRMLIINRCFTVTHKYLIFFFSAIK